MGSVEAVVAAEELRSPFLPSHRERAQQLAELAMHRDTATLPPADRLGHIVASLWGTKNRRLDLDEAWRTLWQHVANGLSFRPSWWRGDVFLDERGNEIDLTLELDQFFRSGAMRHVFRVEESFREHRALLAGGDPRAYLYREYPYKRRISAAPRFGLAAPNPIYYFGYGNYVSNCLAFHARCDNSDAVLTYLADESVLALEVYENHRVAGQVWLVLGTGDDGRRILLVDSVDLFPGSRHTAARLYDAVRAAYIAVGRRTGCDDLILNTRVHTAGAAAFVATRLDALGISYRPVKPKRGVSRLRLPRQPSPPCVFRKAAPWRDASSLLHTLGVRRFSHYLDAWGGFVPESCNEKRIEGVPA
jgi:hypothetical protein